MDEQDPYIGEDVKMRSKTNISAFGQINAPFTATFTTIPDTDDDR